MEDRSAGVQPSIVYDRIRSTSAKVEQVLTLSQVEPSPAPFLANTEPYVRGYISRSLLGKD